MWWYDMCGLLVPKIMTSAECFMCMSMTLDLFKKRIIVYRTTAKNAYLCTLYCKKRNIVYCYCQTRKTMYPWDSSWYLFLSLSRKNDVVRGGQFISCPQNSDWSQGLFLWLPCEVRDRCDGIHGTILWPLLYPLVGYISALSDTKYIKFGGKGYNGLWAH